MKTITMKLAVLTFLLFTISNAISYLVSVNDPGETLIRNCFLNLRF